MLTLIKKCHLYCPEDMGVVDLALACGKVLYIGDLNSSIFNPFQIQTIDAQGMLALPGFIDQHVHITGGGGEAGPASRTPEVELSQLTLAGITTVVGLLGVDSVTRSVEEVLAKARGLEEEGITAYIFSGAYEIPTKTITGSIKRDLVLIDKVLGCGEVAISDHRSAQPSLETLIQLGAESRVGGILGRKAGITYLHVGEGKQGLGLLFEAINKSDLPLTQFTPTHVNRLNRLFYQAIDYLRKGGYIDLTAGISVEIDGNQALGVPHAVERLLATGLDLRRVTVSSDGNGSMPRYDNHGNLVGFGVGSVDVLWEDIKKIVNQGLLPLEKALALITENVARHLKLHHKGRIEVGRDADLVIVDKQLNIDTVIARGKIVVQGGVPLQDET